MNTTSATRPAPASRDRAILTVDTRRPTPLPFAAVNRVAEAFVRRLYGRKILKKLM
jgi:hypothetical protein